MMIALDELGNVALNTWHVGHDRQERRPGSGSSCVSIRGHGHGAHRVPHEEDIGRARERNVSSGLSPKHGR